MYCCCNEAVTLTKHKMKNTRQLIENTNNEVLREILTLMYDEIYNRVESIIKLEEKIQKRELSEWAKELIELSLIHDLCKSVIVYTNENDKVLNFEAGISLKGNYEIFGTILRDGKEYTFSTEAIMAGGYNVQRLHIRYITKTDLPKSKDLVEANKIKNSIKKLSKIERINKQIDYLVDLKAKKTDKIAKFINYNNEDWLNHIKGLEGDALNKYRAPKYTKENFVPFNRFENFDQYLVFIDECNASIIDFEKQFCLEFPKGDVKRLEQSIKKEFIKLEKAM